MTRIHHATTKRAARVGIKLVVEDNEIVALAGNRRLASGLQGNKVLDEAIAKLNGAVAKPARKRAVDETEEVDDAEAVDENEEDEEAEEAEEAGEDDEADEDGKSVVKRRYKQAYRPFRNTCGDDLSGQISNHLKVQGDNGRMYIDEQKLVRFARANGVWRPEYAHLNVGMRRMNLANRLRTRIKKEKYKIAWVG